MRRAGFQQPAEIFFAGDDVFAGAGLEIFNKLVADFQALKLDDADVVFAAAPHLALLQFHERGIHLSCFLIQER